MNSRLEQLVLIMLSLFVFSHSVFAGNDDKKLRLKKRVAVFIFDDKTDRSFGWWNKKGVGEGMSDMLITELVKSGNYRVVERTELDEILKEQNLSQSGVVSAESAAEIGKVLGVELAVMGAVTEFGYKKSDTGGRVKNFGLGVSSQSATVAIDCRMVNTSSGEIMSAENIRKEKSSKGLKVDTQKIDFHSEKDFDESLVGKAARDAVEGVIELIEKNAINIPWQAKVVTEKNGQVFINVGSTSGIRPGDNFFVYRKGEELVDPDTGLSLGSIDSKIGEIKVSNADLGEGKAAQCSIVGGSGFQRGDFVRLD
jgi:curli biogenesis system outer membrane secretion channel CsgG